MRCVVCGRTSEHCKRCHFIHDHIGLLDATIASYRGLRHYPPPWKLGPTIERRVRDAWADYEVPA